MATEDEEETESGGSARTATPLEFETAEEFTRDESDVTRDCDAAAVDPVKSLCEEKSASDGERASAWADDNEEGREREIDGEEEDEGKGARIDESVDESAENTLTADAEPEADCKGEDEGDEAEAEVGLETSSCADEDFSSVEGGGAGPYQISLT